MQIRSKRERNLIVFCGVFVVGILVWNFTSPAGTKASKTTGLPLAEAKKQRAISVRNIARMRQDQDRINREVVHKAWGAGMSADELVPMVVRELQRKAAQSGVHLREIRPLRSRMIAGGAGMGIPLELRFRAPFQPNVIRFLYRSENVGEPEGKMVVDKLDVTSSDLRAKDVDISAQVTVFTVSPSAGAAGDNSNATDKTNKS